jgi:hypothetical protein
MASGRYSSALFTTEAGGQESLRVSFAHSQAFEARVRSATSVDGRVVLWSVQPKQRERFRPNFTFVQGQTAFRPKPGDARELGVLVGRFGELDRDDLVLGYAVLPAEIDLARPVDLYWDDRRLAVTFEQARPAAGPSPEPRCRVLLLARTRAVQLREVVGAVETARCRHPSR